MIFGFLGPIGWNELVIILVIVLLIFGPRRLPDFAEALGKSIRKFKQATNEARSSIEGNQDESPPHDKKDD
ncbi:MAG: twin-arginine translocase TatA/TatE family subunit [Candidatus Krumholzibacteria bacterium]|nr:twin-arginine translocase TatA/TatE family subunit [Candidatus Krumholzibacteria bacterium]MDH4336629.1 twin-arginine translocase TatA/TatE family subunit [Candidatus Krumholzibacteria bacterium]MDH5268972.1 twin-arginine translocase TatA/TatE family subunit [Candidatus Krumholzibacteria bacterium]